MTPTNLHPIDARALVAVDMGAESCRVSLLRWVDRLPHIQVIHRFPNDVLESADGLHWDIETIVTGIEHGLERCAEVAPEGIAGIGVDGWAVDYVRLNGDGALIGNPFCYRDPRCVEAQGRVHERISAETLYNLTGIQVLRFNTIYQLDADQNSGIPASAKWANLPEYVLHRLGGDLVAEYTNATHTGLVKLGKREWCSEVFKRAGLDPDAAPKIVAAGTIVGKVRVPLAKLPAYSNTALIAPACHDTASAVASIPATGDDWAFISSGTWSLVGTVLDAPCVSEETKKRNYTNLGAAGGKACFLKNVNGLWLIRQCMEHWSESGKPWSISDLVDDAKRCDHPDELLDVDDPELLLPGNMPARINAQRKANGLPVLSEIAAGAPAMANLIFHSLAARYGQVTRDIAELTERKLKRLFVVGGGSRNRYLTELTEKATGLRVRPGCGESSTVGNFAIQLAALENRRSTSGADESRIAFWAQVVGERLDCC